MSSTPYSSKSAQAQPALSAEMATSTPTKRAAACAILWMLAGLAFTTVIWWLYAKRGGPTMGARAVRLYLASFAVELALSVDNLFTFIVVFDFFGVEGSDQRRVLSWGILTAMVLRGLFIVAGTAALRAWKPTTYVLAALLIFTAIKMGRTGTARLDLAHSRTYGLLTRLLPLTSAAHSGRFFHRQNGRRKASSLLLCLLVIELTDLAFALDSIPAVVSITSDPFLAYTSNVFAILGLRSFYFVVAAGLRRLHYVQPALAFLLWCLGAKMLVSGPWWRPIEISAVDGLAAVVFVLTLGLLASWIYNCGHAAGGGPARASVVSDARSGGTGLGVRSSRHGRNHN
jgi:tellurite resistance protein TerC